MARSRKFILGAGMTGLAAGFASGLPVYEEKQEPGGICSSYYLRPGESTRLPKPPEDEDAYRFEIGGGHWIFGNQSLILDFINRFASTGFYKRRSSVYFSADEKYVPFPIQNHLRYLESDTAARALAEMVQPTGPMRTAKEWLHRCFGPTLCDLFFYPFHELYTAGLYKTIAPQDAYKSPVNIENAINGALSTAMAAGYNQSFIYPRDDLSSLARNIACQCRVHYGKRVVSIDTISREVHFEDGTAQPYDAILSTLPLNRIMTLTGLDPGEKADPFTSVLVLNIGGVRGAKCSDDHWLYTPDSLSGFHRVGFYSNVERMFLPKSKRDQNQMVSLYVERAYPGNQKPKAEETNQYIQQVLSELRQWDFIEEVEVIDPTWIDVAYTWAWPDANWKTTALKMLEKCNIFSIGRYGCWSFKGIAESLQDGLLSGAAMKLRSKG